MNKFIANSKMFLKRNSSTILTCVGAVGVAATAVVSAKNTVKAVKIIEQEKEKDEKITKKEMLKTVAPVYIPTVMVGLSTIACIFGANTLNKKTQASLMSAYALLDQSYKEYRNKAVEIYGEEADKKIRDGIAQIHYNDQAPHIKYDETNKFFDFYGLQFFDSTLEDIEDVEKALNKMLSKNGYVGLNTLYELLGVECSDTDYEVGWSFNTLAECGKDKIEFSCEHVTAENGEKFFAFTMNPEPSANYLF